MSRYICIRTNEDGDDGAQVAFGDSAEEAFQNYYEYISSDYAHTDFVFYELTTQYRLKATYTLVGT